MIFLRVAELPAYIDIFLVDCLEQSAVQFLADYCKMDTELPFEYLPTVLIAKLKMSHILQ